VTICAHKKRCIFGEISEGGMKLNRIGEILHDEWLETFFLRQNIKQDAFIVMPNHFHGILMITGTCRGVARYAPTAPNRKAWAEKVPGSLPVIIRAFKSAVTKRINKNRSNTQEPIWQRNYYEHVIRDEESLNRIREYVVYNPLKWEIDRENPYRKGEDEFDRWLANFKTRPDKEVGA